MSIKTSSQTAIELFESLNAEENLESQLRNLQGDLAKQKKTSEQLRGTMGDTVGKNIQTKVFKVSQLKVMIVTYREDKNPTVLVEQIEE